MSLLIGSDPELFAYKGGELVSAHGLIPGTKKDPHPVECGAVQVDGMALEFNIDPANSEEEFIRHLNTVMGELRKMLPDYELVADPVADFGKEYIDSQPMEAKILGCDPDYNAYTGFQNTPPDMDEPFRTGAGHIHIGWTEGMDVNDPMHAWSCRTLAKELDLRLAIPATLFDHDLKRRRLYGKLGAFRPKPYGMEYRVLSNKWLESEHYQRWVYRTVIDTFQRLSDRKPICHSLAPSYKDEQFRSKYNYGMYLSPESVLKFCQDKLINPPTIEGYSYV